MSEKAEIKTISKEESEKAAKEYAANLAWANSLTESQIDFLCDGGWYNNTIEGYLILAAQEADFSNEQIRKLKKGLKSAFDWHSKADADKASRLIL